MQDEYYVPLIIQLLLVELIIDVLKIASLNTPDVLSNSFSMLGALILGDFAVQARWLVPEVLVYMAFVAVANYAQHSYEMGYATKLCRMVLLVLIWLWDWWGFAAGVVLTLVLIATTKPLVGKGYLYPLIPFDRRKLLRLRGTGVPSTGTGRPTGRRGRGPLQDGMPCPSVGRGALADRRQRRHSEPVTASLGVGIRLPQKTKTDCRGASRLAMADAPPALPR